MYCTSCGKEIQEGMNFCPYCGVPVFRNGQNAQDFNNAQNYYQQPYGNGQNYGYAPAYGYNEPNPKDVPSAGFNALAFFFPVVGLILYLIWKDSTPKKAKSIGKWALISVAIAVAVYVLMIIVMFAATSFFAFSDVTMDSFIM